MKLSAKGRYAVTAMFDVALNATVEPVSLAAIADRQSISLNYLEQLFGKLRKAGLVLSLRGPGGGYQLAKEQHEITLGQIIAAVDESMDATRCNEGSTGCQDGQRCITHTIWHQLNHKIHDFLQSITLADIVQNEDVLAVASRQTELTQEKERLANSEIPIVVKDTVVKDIVVKDTVVKTSS